MRVAVAHRVRVRDEQIVSLSIGSIVAIVEGAVIFGLLIMVWIMKRGQSGGGVSRGGGRGW